MKMFTSKYNKSKPDFEFSLNKKQLNENSHNYLTKFWTCNSNVQKKQNIIKNSEN